MALEQLRDALSLLYRQLIAADRRLVHSICALFVLLLLLLLLLLLSSSSPCPDSATFFGYCH